MTTLAHIIARLTREALLADVEYPAANGAGDSRRVTAVTTDSRQVAPGTLFCAVRGTTGDGHQFLAEVAERGAVAATVEEEDASVSLHQLRVRDGRLAAAFAAAELWADPWNALTLVGVTGTNGKTTSAALLRHLLGTHAPAASVGTLGVVGADDRVVPGTEGLTTPGPVEVARLLRERVDAGVQSVVMEVSSHALDQSRVAAARFDVALFTNLSRDHLDYHGTPEAYRAAKLRLLDLLKPGGAVVANADDAAWAAIGAPDRRRIRFAVHAEDAEIRAEHIRPAASGTHWTLRAPDGAVPVQLPLFGAYNVANALGAAATLWALGWETERIADGLASVPQVPGRLERVAVPPGGPTVLIDFAHTADALARALAALRPLVRGRLIVVFGAGGDRDRGKRPEMGRAAAEGADFVIVTSDNPRTEDPERIIDEIERGMGSARRSRITDRREAIRRALREAEPDDLVLLAGKGHETYQIRGTERHPFDERAIVRALLNEGENRA